MGPCIEEFVPQPTRFGQLTAEDYERLWHDAWAVTAMCLQELRTACERIDAEFLVFTIPSRMQTEPEFMQTVNEVLADMDLDKDLPYRTLRAICKKSQIRYFDLTPSFRNAYASTNEPLFLIDRHWNRAGHRVATDILLAHLDSESLLPATQ